MKTRLTTFIALMLIVAACGGTASDAGTRADPTGTTAPVTAPTSTTTTVRASTSPAPATPLPAPEARFMSYAYQPGKDLTYDLEVDQHATMHVEGDEATFGEGELPLDADLTTHVSTVMEYLITEGMEPGTTEMTIRASFDDASVSGTMNGRAVDPATSDLGELSQMAPVDTTVVVDEKGNITSIDGMDLTAGLFGGGPLAGLQSLGTENLAKPLGPAFPDSEITVGDSWDDEQSTEGPDGEPIFTRMHHEVTRAEMLNGVEVLVIETSGTSDGFEFDMSELLRALFEGFSGLGEELGAEASTTTTVDIATILAELEFVISVGDGTVTATTWFDPEGGVVRAADQSTQIAMSMRFRGPDQDTGEIVGMSMSMDIDQTIHYALSGPGA